jgi:hypothetical protein
MSSPLSDLGTEYGFAAKRDNGKSGLRPCALYDRIAREKIEVLESGIPGATTVAGTASLGKGSDFFQAMDV